jgi:hypothetical protein
VISLCERKVPGYEDHTCQDCEADQEMTVGHVLLHCRRWQELRKDCLARGLQGGTQVNLKTLLGTSKGLLAATEMVWKTELLAQFSASNLEDIGIVEGDEDAENEGEDEEGG